MNFSSFTSDSLKSLSKLLDKKGSLVAEIQKIEAEIASVFTGKSVKRSGKRRGRPAKKAPKAANRGPRGALGKSILQALESAGSVGVKVADLAKTLKINGTNIHVWFATTGKKNKAIKKVGKGHYALDLKAPKAPVVKNTVKAKGKVALKK